MRRTPRERPEIESKDYDEESAAFAERRKPEFQQQYYDGKTKPPGVP